MIKTYDKFCSLLQHSGVNAGKKRIWKNLKQIMTLERGLPWKQDDPTCKQPSLWLSFILSLSQFMRHDWSTQPAVFHNLARKFFFIFLIEIFPPLPFELKDTINILLTLFSWSIPYITELFSPNYFTLGPASNDLLRKIGIKNKYMCTFWEAELENLTHLF